MLPGRDVLVDGCAKNRARHIRELEWFHVTEGRQSIPIGTILRLRRRAASRRARSCTFSTSSSVNVDTTSRCSAAMAVRTAGFLVRSTTSSAMNCCRYTSWRSTLVALLQETIRYPARNAASARPALPLGMLCGIEPCAWPLGLHITYELRNGLGITRDDDLALALKSPFSFRPSLSKVAHRHPLHARSITCFTAGTFGPIHAGRPPPTPDPARARRSARTVRASTAPARP